MESEMNTKVVPGNNAKTPEINILEIPVTDENTALNIMVQFLTLGQRRGAYSISEAAKIFECLQIFTKNRSAPPPADVLPEN
jgi:hypothetical protein